MNYCISITVSIREQHGDHRTVAEATIDRTFIGDKKKLISAESMQRYEIGRIIETELNKLPDEAPAPPDEPESVPPPFPKVDSDIFTPEPSDVF